MTTAPQPTVNDRPATREPILEVRDLAKHFPLTQGIVFRKQVGSVKAVDGVSFDLYPGETLGIVGESGCGKSMTALSILRLVPDPPGRIVGGAMAETLMQ